MTLEPLVQERAGNASRFVRQQLGLDPVDSRRLLQRLDHMSQQPDFDFARVRDTPTIGHEQITDYSLAAFINKKAVAEDATTFDRCVSGKNFRVDIAQDHLCRAVVIPRKETCPGSSLIVEQGTQIARGKMPEVENLQERSCKPNRSILA